MFSGKTLRIGLLLCAIAGVLLPGDYSVRAQGETPRLEPIDCLSFGVIDEDAQCSYLVVPEDRSLLDGPTIRLPVVVFPALRDDPEPDPIVYLTGGPGGHAVIAAPYIAQQLRPLRRARALIIFDQRGAGFSRPSLDCPEADAEMLDILREDLSRRERIERHSAALLACRDRLVEAGANLTAYTSTDNAADVNDLRIALGYDEWNLLGVSYGTRLALTVMRDFPEGVRSVVLDSVVPPQVALMEGLAVDGGRSISRLFADCAASALCSQNYPDLEATFYDLVDRLNAEPINLRLYHFLQEEYIDAIIDGDELMLTAFQMLYSTETIPRLPRMIASAAEGDMALLALMTSQMMINWLFMSEGMYFSVECSEELPFSTAESVAAASESVEPRFREIADVEAQLQFDVCAAWGMDPPDPVENEAVVSDIPTLLLAGQYDPITPPAWTHLAGETLSRSYYYEFAGVGHGAIFAHNCPLNVARDFLDYPFNEPDASCVERLDPPDFQ